MVKIPTPVPIPHLRMRTFRYTRASKKNSIYLPMMNPMNPTSQLDASGLLRLLPHHHLRPRKVPMGLGACQTLVYERVT